MTAYRKFKLPEAAWPPAKVANVSGSCVQTLASLATLAGGSAKTTNLDGKANDCAADTVPEPYLDDGRACKSATW
jgi:hypothetical protein